MNDTGKTITMEIDGAQWCYDEHMGAWEHKGADGVQITVIPWRAREAQQLARALGVDPELAHILLERGYCWVWSEDQWYTETDLWQVRLWYDELRGWIIAAQGYGYAEGLGRMQCELDSLRLPDALAEAEEIISELWGYQIGNWRYANDVWAYEGMVAGRRVQLYYDWSSKQWVAAISRTDEDERVNTYLEDPRMAIDWLEGIYGKTIA